MRNEVFKTLFSRMLFTYLSVILCLLLMMGVTVSSMVRQQYLKEAESNLKTEADKINTIILEEYIHEEKRSVASQKILTAAYRYDALIQVVDTKGNHHSFFDDIVSEEKWGEIAENTKQLEDENGNITVLIGGLEIIPSQNSYEIKSGRTSQWVFGSNKKNNLSEQGIFVYDMVNNANDMPTLSFVRSIINNEKFDGSIIMHLDMRGINQTIKQVYLYVLLVSLISIAAAVLAVYYLTTRMTKPITDMNATVRKYSKGDFDLRLDSEGADEVAQLAKSFNYMANALNAQEQTRRSFVANVSHELRSPLTSMSGFLEAIRDGTIPQEKQSDYLDIVMDETRRMIDMVNDLLDLARIESGKTDMHITVFDINETARRVLLTFEARIVAKQLHIELNLVEPNCYVEADADQIGQVFRNLIENAIKFSPDGGDLIIETKNISKDKTEVSVKDSGPGISIEDARQIFDRFYKVEKAHTPSAQSGTGLGLSIARVVMDQHEQDIYVDSKPGEGAKFVFTLKRAKEAIKRTPLDD